MSFTTHFPLHSLPWSYIFSHQSLLCPPGISRRISTLWTILGKHHLRSIPLPFWQSRTYSESLSHSNRSFLSSYCTQNPVRSLPVNDLWKKTFFRSEKWMFISKYSFAPVLFSFPPFSFVPSLQRRKSETGTNTIPVLPSSDRVSLTVY